MINPETSTPARAEFVAGPFTITHFSEDPNGFEFASRSIHGRTGAFEPNERLELDEAQRAAVRGGMGREMEFNNVDPVRVARDAWKEAWERGDNELAAQRKEEFFRVRGEYINRGKKIGFRAIKLTGSNKLEADTQLVSYPVSLLSAPETSHEVEKLSRTAAVALVVETSDGQLVVQHRSKRNNLYADIPGASVAGMVDASLSVSEDRVPGTPDPVDTDYLKGSIMKEASEELGVSPDDFEGLRIVGVAEDHYKPHDEILFSATLNLSAEELQEVSRTSSRNKNLGDADFEEKFFTIEGSFNAIESLLTEVKCPLPPTHAAAMIAAGYSMVLRDYGKEAAHVWRENIQDPVRQNYEAIDAIVVNYYKEHPEVLDQVPERYRNREVPARNLTGYSPAYTPEEQGLPALEDEMVRTGLMEENRR